MRDANRKGGRRGDRARNACDLAAMARGSPSGKGLPYHDLMSPRRISVGAFWGTVLALAACSSEPAQQPAPADLGTMQVTPTEPCAGVPATGKCLNTQTIGACVTDGAGAQRLVQTPCSAGEICTTDGFGPLCQLTASCRDGSSRCTSTVQLEVCSGGTWQRRPCASGLSCQAFPGVGAGCIMTGSPVTVSGQIRYQYLVPNNMYTGYQNQPVTGDAAGVFVVVVDGNEVLGSGFTDAQGRFSLAAWRAPSTTGEVLFQPVSFRADDSATLAVAAPIDGMTIGAAMNMWTYRVGSLPAAASGRIDIGTQLVTGDPAGALHVFTWASRNISRATALFGAPPDRSLAILWKPGLDVFCGACFLNRAAGGTVIGRLRLDTTIALSGSQQSPLHWATSVISHEVGHYLMDSYSKPPGEGGAHYIGVPSSPGLAWSEGFATFSGQSSISQIQGTLTPVYFTVQTGTAAWIDISRGLSSQGALPRPDPKGSLTQKLEEHMVSGMLWDLWRTLGDAKIFPTLRSGRVTGPYNRGYSTVDLVDYADALSCSGAATMQQLDSSLRQKYGFPWDDSPLCP